MANQVSIGWRQRDLAKSKIILHSKPNLLRAIKTRPKFRFGDDCPGNLKILSLPGLSWLDAWIAFSLRNTLGFHSPIILNRLKKPVLLKAVGAVSPALLKV